ncbi:MAG: L-histidine N(alpha)-methyltransferase [Rubrivivax sp.]|jgi:dimethylhistidine N-methyltransferase|nr:L-histidine N(alpha)-methyltransferase [Rubrivivax sp.]
MTPPRFLQLDDPAAGEAPAAEIVRGLLARPSTLPPKFFYDALGSTLFDAITLLPEYYPTRTEAAIVAAQGAGICAAVVERLGAGCSLVDLGAGNCRKAAWFFGGLPLSRYVAVDISAAFLRDALAEQQKLHPTLEMVGVGLDFSRRLALPAELVGERALVFYPGSSIGNFTPDEALGLLRQARTIAPQAALLIGVDLVKDRAVLEAAYDDAVGLTAAFNLNLLRHANRLVGCDFDPRQWRHVALFDEPRSRIEMHLEARADLVVRWPGGERRYAAGERIHTENSYKWRLDDFAALLRDAGYVHVQHWTDERGWFALMLAS